MINADKIYEGLLFMLAKQQVQEDISKQVRNSIYTQYSNDTCEIVLIRDLVDHTRWLATFSNYANSIIRLENIFATEEKTEKAWDALATFNIKKYPLQLLHDKGIPTQHNLTEEELKKARLP